MKNNMPSDKASELLTKRLAFGDLVQNKTLELWRKYFFNQPEILLFEQMQKLTTELYAFINLEGAKLGFEPLDLLKLYVSMVKYLYSKAEEQLYS